MSTRAADEFETIHARMIQLRRETAKSQERKHVNLKGEEIGSCAECETNCTACTGNCSWG